MATAKAPNARVNRGAVNKKKVGDRVTTIAGVCDAGAQCVEITGSLGGAAALADLKSANTKVTATLVSHTALAIAYRASCKAVHTDVAAPDLATSTYISAVNTIAAGDAALIAKAGFQSSQGGVRVTIPDLPTNVRSKLGKATREAVAELERLPGRGAVQGEGQLHARGSHRWEELDPGTSRRRTITAPAPSAQFLPCVAAIGNEVVSSVDGSDHGDRAL